MSDERFPKHERLRKRRDYLNVEARKVHKLITAHLIILAARNSKSHARLGITASKRIGIAVTRNSVKRLLREVYRRNKATFPSGYDVVLIARKQDRNTCYHTLLQEIQNAMESRTW